MWKNIAWATKWSNHQAVAQTLGIRSALTFIRSVPPLGALLCSNLLTGY